MNKQLSILEREDSERPSGVAVVAMTESQSLMSVISEAARDKETDVGKLEKLMALYERVQDRDAKREFNVAMSDAQQEMRPVAADAQNPQTRSRYASFAALDRALRPIYTKNGFGLSFDTDDSPKPNHIRVLCEVSHRAGHSHTYKLDMPADGKGAKGGDVMTLTHATGAAMTYGQRYLLKAIFNIAIGDDDDNGADRADDSGPISAEQVQHIRDLIEKTKADVEAFCGYFKIEAVPELKVKDYQRAIAALNLKDKKIKEKTQ